MAHNGKAVDFFSFHKCESEITGLLHAFFFSDLQRFCLNLYIYRAIY